MTPSPLKEAFEKILKNARESDEAKRFLPILESMREAMKELQDGGYRVSLEVRPAGDGFPRELNPAPYANGTMTIDGTSLDFTLSGHSNYSEYAILQTYMGNAAFRSQWYMSGALNIKDSVISILLEAKARQDMMSEFNMGPGVSRVLPTKPAGPAKLST